MRGGLLAAWFASLGLTSWRTVSHLHRPPLPSEVVSTLVVFGGLSLISASDQAAPVAAVFGWGVVVAQAMGFFPFTPGPTSAASRAQANPITNIIIGPKGIAPAGTVQSGGTTVVVPGVGTVQGP